MTWMTTKSKRRRTTQRVSPALKGFVEGRRSTTVLLKDIQQHVVAKAIAFDDADRERHLIHVSEMSKDDWCPREAYYKLAHTEPTDTGEAVYQQREIIYENGNDTHTKWQTWMAEMGKLWGLWECLVCGHTWEDTSPVSCPACFYQALKYREVPLASTTLPLLGHADGAIEKSLVEIKGIGVGTIRLDSPSLVSKCTFKAPDGHSVLDMERVWKSITRPLKSHQLQGLFYLWLAEQMGYDFDQIVFIYEYKPTQATKEFVIPFSKERIQPLLDTLVEVIHLVEHGDPPPPRPAGFDKHSRPCNSCVFRKGCYKESDDDSQAAARVSPRRRIIGSKEAVGAATDLSSSTPEQGVSFHTRRPDRTRRLRTDDAVQSTDPVGRVHERATSVRGGRRTVVRSSGGARSRDSDAVQR
jgi:hypothetical protein